MDFERCERALRAGLAGPLPGTDGHVRLAPRPRVGWRPGALPPDGRQGGVLVLVYPGADGAAHLVLTVRAVHMKNHAGQVSLPGGAVEHGESYEQAALREAREEVGVDPATVRLLGPLSPLHVPVSGFVLHPRVATTPRRPRLRPQQEEVARILEVGLEELADPRVLSVETRRNRRGTVDIPAFRLQGWRVWGATAMVLSELLCVLGLPPDPWGSRRS